MPFLYTLFDENREISTMRQLIMLFAVLAALTLYGTSCPNAADGTIDIGSRLELFVDTFLIERMVGTELALHHPVPREAVMVHDAPWEGSGTGYHTVFLDDGVYRMYYKAWQLSVSESGLEIPHDTIAAYAESRDGIVWEKPNLGLFEFEGSKDNNIVWIGPGSHDFTPFRDTNPACPPSERYKAVGNGGKNLLALVSPDGIRWSLIRQEPILTEGAFDSQNLAFRDDVRGEYRVYFRDFREGSRDIKTAVSSDFINWQDAAWLEYPGATVEQLYTNQIKPYFRAPHIFIGFPSRYVERAWNETLFRDLPLPEHRKQRASASPRYGSAVTDALFMTSRDGVEFKRWGEAFLRPGPSTTDNWAYGDNYIAWHVVPTKSSIPGAPDELSLYATESYWTGDSSVLRRYTIRMDGFVSLHAPAVGGEVVTKPIVFSGKRLVINAATSAAGYVKAEIQSASGRPMQGFSLNECMEMFGDDTARTVRWQQGGDTGILAGKPVRLRFFMKDADIYSFRFAE